MLALLVLGACSLFGTLVLTPYIRDFFAFLEMVDPPDAGRKLHLRPIPRVGGIPIALCYFLALAGILILGPLWKELLAQSTQSLNLLWRLLPALIIVFITGLLDDFRGLTPWQKLGGQLLAALCAFAAGVRFGPAMAVPQALYVELPVTVAWLVFCSNAYNLIDGLDGLASGLALLGASGLLLAGLIHNEPVVALIIVPFLGALLGFLFYNLNPASVFLGDSGSLLIGFLLGCFGLILSHQGRAGMGPALPLMVVAVPGIDVGVSVLRRFLRGGPIFGADRNHIHHRLLSMGMSPPMAALSLCGVSALGVGLAILQTVVRPGLSQALIAACVLGGFVGVTKLRYIEFRSLLAVVTSGELLATLRRRIRLSEYAEALAAARLPEDCWNAVSEICVAAGFRHVTLELSGRRFELPQAAEWSLQFSRTVVELPNQSRITFLQTGRVSGLAEWIGPIVAPLEEKLRAEIWQTPGDDAGQQPLKDVGALSAAAN